jgi:hypothetical protein
VVLLHWIAAGVTHVQLYGQDAVIRGKVPRSMLANAALIRLMCSTPVRNTDGEPGKRLY